jgi:hypothetical protein
MRTTYVWRGGQFVNKETGDKMEATGDGISMPMIQSDYPAYYSHASGKMIEGRAARRDDLARTGCRPFEPDEGPKTCRSEKWAKKLGLEHDPNAGRPKHWADWQTNARD